MDYERDNSNIIVTRLKKTREEETSTRRKQPIMNRTAEWGSKIPAFHLSIEGYDLQSRTSVNTYDRAVICGPSVSNASRLTPAGVGAARSVRLHRANQCA